MKIYGRQRFMMGCSLFDAVAQAGRYRWNPREWSLYHKLGTRVITTNLNLSAINFHKVEGPKLN
jgi:hypothetical protein